MGFNIRTIKNNCRFSTLLHLWSFDLLRCELIQNLVRLIVVRISGHPDPFHPSRQMRSPHSGIEPSQLRLLNLASRHHIGKAQFLPSHERLPALIQPLPFENVQTLDHVRSQPIDLRLIDFHPQQRSDPAVDEELRTLGPDVGMLPLQILIYPGTIRALFRIPSIFKLKLPRQISKDCNTLRQLEIAMDYAGQLPKAVHVLDEF